MKEKSSNKKKRPPLSPAAQRGRQIREERRRRKRRRFFRAVLILLAVIAIAALILIFGFRLKTVNVTGNSRYTNEEILDLLQFDDASYQNTLLFYFEKRNMDVAGIPFIDAIYMDIGGVDTINVEVVEKVVTGCIEDNGNYIYIDTDGIVCEISDTRQEDIPLIEGLDYENPQLNQMLTVTDENVYNTLLSLTLQLQKYELSADKVIFDADGSMSMQMGDIQVMLGTSGNMEDKIAEVNNLLPELTSRGLKGTLHLENYDSTTDSIIFTKES